MDRKECYRLTHLLSKISGYATAASVTVEGRLTFSHIGTFTWEITGDIDRHGYAKV